VNYLRIAILVVATYASQANAVLRIEITGSNAAALPIAIVPFGWQSTVGRLPVEFADVIGSDLERSGQFRAIPVDQMIHQPHRGAEIKFENWRILGVENIVVGNVTLGSDSYYTVEFQLFDVFKARQLVGQSFKVPTSELRNVAHAISDEIYRALTGERGAFNTRIAYVVAESSRGKMSYRLEIADTDGYNARAILRSSKPIMSPAWSPDSRHLAYVSFESNRSEIWVHAVFTGTREVVAKFKGINGAPVWSPDGRKLALTSSHKGNPDIYLLDLSSKEMRQLTNDWAIDTEPAWMPDGQAIVFTSGRSGSPQLYFQELGSSQARRLTFEGKYNTSATVSPDGKTIAMVHVDKGRYQIAALDMKTGLFRLLTDGRLDESPSFAPNGSIVLYATEQQGKGVLAAVSIDGRTRQSLAFADGNIREPTWGPFPSQRR
jgi:TolB protein